MNFVRVNNIFFVLVHITIKILWSYLFFNYPTLEDTHRAFSFMHSLKAKDIYIYQLDVSYHGALIPTIFYYPFVKLLGLDILTFRIANCILSGISLLITLGLLKDDVKRTVFFLLFTFTPLFFQRNILFVGNYAFIPILTILTIKTEGYLKGFFLGISIQNNILSSLLILFFPERKIKEFLIGLIIGSSPMTIFNLYNFTYSGIIPTFEDMKLRPLKNPQIDEVMKLLILTAPFIPSILSRKNLIPITTIFLFLSSEERYQIYIWTVLIFLASENYSQKKFINILPLFSIIYFVSNIPETKAYKGYIMYAYGPKHYVIDKQEIQNEIDCVINNIKDQKIEKVLGDIISTDFIKFYYPEIDIYYISNPWSYVIPNEFKDEPEHIIIYSEQKDHKCLFHILKNKKERKRKIYFRETGIRNIISGFIEKLRR